VSAPAKVSRSTVIRELNIIRGCFSRAVEWDRLSLSPMRRIKAYRVDDTRLRVCTPTEIKALLESSPEETKSKRKPRPGAVALTDLRLLARLTLESLPRLSECLAQCRDDIGSTYLMNVRSKSGRARQVPLTPELRADLLARCHASGYVFGVGKEGEPPKAAAVSVAFTGLAASLKLPGVSHHSSDTPARRSWLPMVSHCARCR
jgi:integrase